MRNPSVTRMIWYAGTMLTALAMLAASTTAAAQRQGRSRHTRSDQDAADPSRAERGDSENVKKFRGIAAKLNTSPEALESAFARARQTNPELSRGSFIAANVLAANLGAQHPNITTAAILSGLQSGKSVDQTLQSLGLSASEAKQARRAADRQMKDAEKEGKQKSRRDANERNRDNR
jgi:hypothetical protein